MDQQDIISLLEKAASGNITGEEQQSLADGLRGTDETLFRELMQRHERIVLESGKTGEPDALLYERISNRIAAIEEDTPTVRVRWRSFAAAAAILVLLLAGGAYWYFNPPATTTIVDKLDEAPGGNKAVLTLGDGSNITLDSAANGMLGQQGNVKIIKLANGQLAYDMGDGNTTAVMYNTVRTPRGGQYRILLPDGTDVWLNAESSITYPTAFAGEEKKGKGRRGKFI